MEKFDNDYKMKSIAKLNWYLIATYIISNEYF